MLGAEADNLRKKSSWDRRPGGTTAPAVPRCTAAPRELWSGRNRIQPKLAL